MSILQPLDIFVCCCVHFHNIASFNEERNFDFGSSFQIAKLYLRWYMGAQLRSEFGFHNHDFEELWKFDREDRFPIEHRFYFDRPL